MTEPSTVPHIHGHEHTPHLPLNKKLGPAPVWVWGLILVGGAVLFYVYRQRNANASVVPPATDPLSGVAVTPGGTVDGSSFGGGGGVTTGNSPSPTGNGLTTNAEWAIHAEQLLAGQGGNPLTISTALSHYLNGQDLSPAEQAIVSQAIALIGPPPQGVLPATVTPTPTTPTYSWRTPPPGTTYTHNLADGSHHQVWPDGSDHLLTAAQYAALGNPKSTDYGKAPTPIASKPPPVLTPPPAHSPTPVPSKTTPPPAKPPRYYTVKSGDTLWGIATRYYGKGSDYIKISAANHISNPSLIHPGQRLIIPY